MRSSNHSITVVSQSLITADSKSSPIESLRLSASDLPMLTFQYIQKGCLFSGKSPDSLFDDLKHSLSKALTVFPPLAGRLLTDSATGHISITCSNAGALFIHARSSSLHLNDIFDPACAGDVPAAFELFFALDDTISFDGHTNPIVAVQVTELADSFFVGCSVNHAVVDGTSFWHFFNTFAEICRGARPSLPPPNFSREDSFFFTETAINFPGGRPEVKLAGDDRVRERIFHFSGRSVLAIKERANENNRNNNVISCFQSLCAQLWRSVTRARKLAASKTTTFSMAVNCRSRVNPKMDPWYFGNAIQIISAATSAGELVTQELRWSADLLHRSVMSHDDRTVRKRVEDWERDPGCFPLGNVGEANIVIGSSPRFPMYDNDFGWGRPVAVRSGKANKSDGMFSAFPGREGDGSIDIEVLLKPEAMMALQNDAEFVYYINLQ